MTRLLKYLTFLSLGLLFACSRDSGTAATSNSVSLTKKGQDYTFTLGASSLSVSPAEGGRISSLKMNGEELLFVSSANKSTIWGSVLWTSPQIEWNWPPIETLDSKPYSEKLDNNQLTLSSKSDTNSGYQLHKSYAIDTTKNCFSFLYTVVNNSQQTKSVAAWEVTRLNPEGIIFFPAGNTEFTSGLFNPIPIQKFDELVWVAHPQKTKDANHLKLMTDGAEGWLAYLRGKTLLVKEFADVPVELLTPNEGEIELYASAEGNFWEADQQGVATKLAPGESLTWQVNWYLFDLQHEQVDTSNAQSLAQFIRQKLKGAANQ